MSAESIKSYQCDEVDIETISRCKRNLEPFLLVKCDSFFSDWNSVSSWTCCLSEIDDHLAVECCVTNEDIHNQCYFGSEAAAMLTQPPSSPSGAVVDETSPPCWVERSSVNASLCLEDYRQDIGGMDIIDNLNYRRRCLNSIRLSLLQHHNSSSALDLPVEGFETPSSRTVAKKFLLWSDTIGIIQHRGLLGNGGKSLFTHSKQKVHPLTKIPGRLCFKVSVGHCTKLLDNLQISRLCYSTLSFTAVVNPLLLQNNTFCLWAVINERGSGTRSHTNVMGSHGWHLLMEGKKKWRIAHPLDKYLLTDEKDGSIANLWSPDPQKYPLAHFARVYEFSQEAGQFLFIPSDAVHSDIAEEDCFALQMNFVEDSCYPMFEYQTNQNLVLLSSLKFDNGYLQQFTQVDIVISGPSEEKLPKIVIRGTVWCTDTNALWTELGARVELAAFHDCFQAIGDYLLYCLKEPYYVVGLPRGFYLCVEEHRLVLHYETPLETYSNIEDALLNLSETEELDFRYFTVPFDRYPVPHRFSCTMSQEGSLLSYVPLSVLFNQPWSFEEKIIKTCIALPQVILEKAKHPQGFVRPGSVWHYSNKHYSDRCQIPSQESVTSMHQACSSGSNCEPSSRGRSSALFYCSPLLRIPITLHPRKNSFVEKPTSLASPRIDEFAWNVEILEKYGRVELLQFKKPVQEVMRSVVCSDPHFKQLQNFLVQHGLYPLRPDDVSLNSESLVASILWILCSPCVTGFTCPAGVQYDSGEFISSSDMYQFQMIGLPTCAAFSLLERVEHSPFDYTVSQLCNWICDIDADDTEVQRIFSTIRSYCDVEMAEILEQIRRVKYSLMNCSSGSQVNPEKLEVLSKFIRSLADS